MKSLLENDLPAFYGVGRRCICDENTTSLLQRTIHNLLLVTKRVTRLFVGIHLT